VADTIKYRRKALIISGLSTFMATLDSSIVNVSLPTISRELNTTVNMVGWVILAYSIAVFSLLMIFGAVSEKKGYQFTYKYGFAIFMVGSGLCGLSLNIHMLIIARVIQGIGAALLISVGPAVITRSSPPEERGRALSIIAMVVSTGLMLGPPLGGFIIGLAGWRWIFWVNVPVCIYGFYFTIRYFSNFPISDPDKKISIPGAVFLSIGLLTMMISLLLFGQSDMEIIYIIVLLVVSVVFLLIFLYFESKPETSLIGIGIFKNRIFAFSGASMLLVFVSLISISVLMPFYLEEIKKFEPEKVGLILAIIPVCGFILATPAGYLADKFQAWIIASVGAALLVGAIVLMRLLDVASPLHQVLLPLLFAGVGMAIFSTPNTSTIMGSVKHFQLGSAAGILATIRTLGITLGAGLSVSFFSYFRQIGSEKYSDGTAAFMYGYRAVYHIIVFIIILAVILSLLRGRNRRPGRNV